MAKATGLSHTTISRIRRTFGLQPHRTETFKLSPNPLLIDKATAGQRSTSGPSDASTKSSRVSAASSPMPGWRATTRSPSNTRRPRT